MSDATITSITFRIVKDGQAFTITLRPALLADHFQRAEESPKHEALVVKGALRIHHIPPGWKKKKGAKP